MGLEVCKAVMDVYQPEDGREIVLFRTRGGQVGALVLVRGGARPALG